MKIIYTPMKLPGLIFVLLILSCTERPLMKTTAIVKSEFIYTQASFSSAHASTIVETGGILMAAWFGGTAEGNQDVGIWLSRNNGTQWSDPIEVANGLQSDGNQYPCWNPVLFQPAKGPLLLFYKVGPNPREWWGMVKVSNDYGQTWLAEEKLPEGFLGPIRAKPVELPDGTMIAGSSTEHAGWVVHMERFYGFKQNGVNSEQGSFKIRSLSSADDWQKTGALNDPGEFGAIQPTLLVHSAKKLQILCRSQQGIITEAWSEDGGLSWGTMSATTLPNPNAGIDVTKLSDGRFLLVYNPISQGRNKLALALSREGINWHSVAFLEDSPGEYSYPAQIQSQDGLVHITYTWKRQRIKYVVVDPTQIE